MKNIDIIIPVYNEASAVDRLRSALETVFEEMRGFSFNLIFVDDGSTDGTLLKLLEWQKQSPKITIIELTRNFGKEAAITTGLSQSKGDACILFDADLQDPVDLIKNLANEWVAKEVDIVLARRSNYDSDPYYRRVFRFLFYKFFNALSRQNPPDNVGDTRLLSARVVEAVMLLKERNRYMKGLMNWVGFEHCIIDFTREKRVDGVSKFNFWKLWNFALEGIFSNSSLPARIWLYIGCFFFLAGLLLSTVVFFDVLINGVSVPGYASLAILISVFGGIHLIAIGVLGEYIGRIFIEVQARPISLIKEIHVFKKKRKNL